MKLQSYRHWFWISGLSVALISCTSSKIASTDSRDSQSEQRSPASLKNIDDWTLGTYLPENLSKKVYLNISQGHIKTITEAPPAGAAVIDTETIAFPGLIDMHGHIKYNVLPLWENAKGQFLNRHEWRNKYAPYGAVSFNMKAYKSTVCANVRWAEIMSIVGGTTSMQGIGNDGACTQDFGIHNVELKDEYERKLNARGATDVVMPGLVGSVYEKRMAPYIAKGDSYDVAYAKMLNDTGVTKWVASFVSEPHNVANGIKLMTGLTVTPMPPPMTAPLAAVAAENPEAEFQSYQEQLKTYLGAAPFYMKASGDPKKPGDLEDQITAMSTFILGSLDAASNTKKGGYVTAKADEKTALDFITKGGVLNVPGDVRRYIGMFEAPRKSWLASLNGPDFQPIVAHIAEGQRREVYNSKEYKYLKAFGLAKPGMVMIHGVGLSAADLRDAAKNNISIVWSPFSNTLLYGETLDVAAAKRAKVNLAIGSDWTPTGSKNLLDELKIARRYLNKKKISSIKDRDLVDMATINAAKALKLDDRLGAIKENYIADLFLIQKGAIDRIKSKDAYSALVAATAADVGLVVVDGQPIYGEPSSIDAAVKIFKDQTQPETLPANRVGACNFQKQLRLPNVGKFPNLASYKVLEETLTSANKAWAEAAKLDPKQKSNLKYLAPLNPIFACEDAAYSTRVAKFIERELDLNRANREKERGGDPNFGFPKLLNTYNPLGDTLDVRESNGDPALAN